MIIIKIGGGKSINIKGIIKDIADIEESYVIVHGANALRDELAEKLDKPKKVITSISGYSSVFSDEEALDIMMMAYSGLKNKRIVELCQQHGINAVGLSGVDGKAVLGKRNQRIRVKEGEKLRIIRDFSGKPKSINVELLNLLLSNGYVPVLTVPILDENNIAINSENDDIVRLLSKKMGAKTIIQLIEAKGFLENSNEPDSVIKKLDSKELEKKENQVEGRMKRKVLALRKLFENGAAKVIISDGRAENPIKDALAGKGTVIS
ncbi:[LysW]-aminoadipate kinase [candidate division KSB1 bacterium]|nr:[LysW]-aminoadipate kinase [candidate division KSB1 bacterium]MBL7092672.1 [LysW]-aminoadipate kinase [candidate division KSB1 bacterium]